ncbi:H-type small acid-soluble spore protein [Paenibacillus xerothermodurans]|uniref:H-type small acid-soluble spore protein n=1 Tax=Paenibacillus xerothermodurans TaxID=1977292 RepID=A0A2W1N4C7_PAEXE|nr:H-type small acid-soluble spore protein [Paenibacillus xerothermodurans]PZE19609.1 H-type small acid-soluble spore protein [Paenibacillus xerothermodurans]
MQVTRAKEILQSEARIDVKLDGTPVWIDSVDAEQATASVHMEEQPEVRRVVSVTELQEA